MKILSLLYFLFILVEVYSQTYPCITDLSTCCSASQGIHRGDWYFPDGDRLPFNGDIYENRGPQRVYLRRNDNANSPTGIYRCDIPTNAVHHPTDTSVRDTVYVGLYTSSGNDFLFLLVERVIFTNHTLSDRRQCNNIRRCDV